MSPGHPDTGQRTATFAIEMLEWMHRKRYLPGVTTVEVEPVRRRSARVTLLEGRQRFVIGGDLGVNTSASCNIAADKFLTKELLSTAGIRVPHGALLDLDSSARVLSGSLPGFPRYIKPIYGSCGDGVFRVVDDRDSTRALDRLRARGHRFALAEEEVIYPEFRLIMLDGRCIIAYAREAIHVFGDGRSSLKVLIEDLGSRLDWGHAQRAEATAFVQHSGMNILSIPSLGHRVRLSPVSNLSAGGSARDVSEQVHEEWSRLGSRISSLLGLRLCGIDLATESLSVPHTSVYSVLEVNSTPSLLHYARLGDRELRRAMTLFATTFARDA